MGVLNALDYQALCGGALRTPGACRGGGGRIQRIWQGFESTRKRRFHVAGRLSQNAYGGSLECESYTLFGESSKTLTDCPRVTHPLLGAEHALAGI